MLERRTPTEDPTETESGTDGDATDPERTRGDVSDGEVHEGDERDGTRTDGDAIQTDGDASQTDGDASQTDGDVSTGDRAADGTDRGTAGQLPTDERDAGGSRPRSLAKDDAFHLLQNSRRRAVLRYLLARPERDRFRMRDLAEEIAAWEHDTTVRQLSSDERQRVYIALYQSHLPKLDDHGVISYNQSRGFVEPTPLVDVLAPFLEDGLDATTQELSLDSGGPTASSGAPPDGRLVPTLSTLFGR